MGAVGAAAPRSWALCIFAAAALLRRAALAQDLENPQPRLRLLALRCADRPIDLEPPFKPLKYVYMASIDFSEEEFSIDAIAEEGMEVTNMDELVAAKLISPGTEHEVEVKVQNKRDLTKATYSIKVGRKDGRDVTLFNLDTPGSDFSPAFHAERFRYTVKVPADLDRLYMRFAPLDVGQTFEIKSLPPDFVAGQPQLWTQAPATIPTTSTFVEQTTTTQWSVPGGSTTAASIEGHAFTEAATTTLAVTTTTPAPTTTQPAVLQCFQVDTWYASGPDRSPDMEGARKETVEDEFECQERCARTEDCAWFSYWPDGACHLQDKHAVEATAAGPIAGPKRCQAPCFEKNIQYGPTPDMPHTERTTVKSALECQARCAAIQGCAHFTYWPDGGCHLQDTEAVAIVTMDSEVIGGPPDCMPNCLEKNTWYGPEKNMAGQVKSVEVTTGQCQARCAGAAGCAHFSYWPDGSCHLQDYAASPVTAKQGVVAGPPDCDVGGDGGMARRLHDVTIENVGTVPSGPPGETQYTVIERWFSIDTASSRLVTINVWAPNGDAHLNRTYRLQVSRENCPPHRPYYAPDTQACSVTCNTGYFPNDEVLRCESCSPRCLMCAAWDDCQVCEASQWRVLHFVQRIGGHCHMFQIPWKNIGGSVLAFMVLLGMICHCCLTCCSEHRPRKGNAFGLLPKRRRSKATADEAGGETDRLLDAAGEEPIGEEAS